MTASRTCSRRESDQERGALVEEVVAAEPLSCVLGGVAEGSPVVVLDTVQLLRLDACQGGAVELVRRGARRVRVDDDRRYPRKNCW